MTTSNANTTLVTVLWMSSIVAFAAQTAPRARVRDIHVPDVGVQAPQFVLKARRGVQECLTDFAHKDPCAVVSIEGQRYTVAWDAKSGLITYILTTDLHFLTDSELSVGGMCRLSDPLKATQYMDWIIAPEWIDTARNISGEAKWYAVLEKTGRDYTRIKGFVQSQYLKPKQ
jgi:hypothetical protein